MEVTRARLLAINRKIAETRSDPDEIPIFEDKNHLNRLLVEDFKPIYASPSDLIDEFGRIKVTSEVEESGTFVMPTHLQTSGPEALEKIKNYMKRRFSERLLQSRALAASSEQVYTSWRSRTRKREAEWGDPEDLGLITNDPRPEEAKIATVYPQMAVEPKFLLPNYFVPNIIATGSKLYYSNRPSMLPSQPFSLFNANTAVWSPSERKTFIELYLQHPKNFGRISAHLPYKSCEQCVEFYYRHKKEYRLKQMVASYRKAMVAQRKLILNTDRSSASNLNNAPGTTNNTTTNTTNAAAISNNPLNNMNILPPVNVEEESSTTTRKKTGRPVGRPKNKDRY